MRRNHSKEALHKNDNEHDDDDTMMMMNTLGANKLRGGWFKELDKI